jgi:hypothetical protein
LDHWIDVGNDGGNRRASAGVEIAVMSIQTSGVSMSSDNGSSRKCHGLGRRLRRPSLRSTSGSGPTRAGGESG